MDLITQLEQRKMDISVRKEVYYKNREKETNLQDKLGTITELEDYITCDINNVEKALKAMKTLKVVKRDNDSNTITNSLKSIIDQLFPYENFRFSIKSKVRGNYTYSRLETYKGNSTKPRLLKYTSGKGLRQSLSFTAIYTLIALSDTTPTLILDECFSSVSASLSDTISKILQYLCSIGFQILIIEHNDNVFRHIQKMKVYNLEKVFTDGTERTNIKNIDTFLNAGGGTCDE